MITELLLHIQRIARDHNLSEPFLCGGAPRDKVLGRIHELKDIDITTGDESVHNLAIVVARSLPGTSYKRHSDGHAELNWNGLKIDFSSNFRVPHIQSLLTKIILHPSEMQMELYSRDFTCNALLWSLDLKTIKDPTGLGLQDIKNRLLKTCLPPSLTLGSQTKRIPRVFYLAAKLDFEVDPEIIFYIKANPNLFLQNKPQYLIEKLHSAFKYNSEKTKKLLQECGVWHLVPASPILTSYLI